MELKFRAWDRTTMKMYKCIVGNTDKECDDYICPLVWTGSNWVHSDTCEIMQYTGRKDSNGTEIYKDYIVRVSKGNLSKCWIGAVKWGVYSDEFTNCVDYGAEVLGVDTWLVNGYPLSELILEGCKVEVIGNIYENPDLLEDN